MYLFDERRCASTARWSAFAIAVCCLPALLICAGGTLARPQAGGGSGVLEATSGLGRKLYALPDDKAVLSGQKQLAADPRNAGLALAVSQTEAGQRQYREAIATCTKALEFAPKNAALYLERGHRELGLREFTAGTRDLEQAAALDPKKMEVFYHLGLAHYFQSHFDAAADSFRKALSLASNNDGVIDASNWLYVSLRRAGKQEEAAQALKRITPDMKNIEPHYYFYLQLLRFYQGAVSEKDVLPPKPANPSDVESELAFDTISYGVGNWKLYNHDTKGARELFTQVVEGNAWNAWGFVGAETDLVRLKGKSGAAAR